MTFETNDNNYILDEFNNILKILFILLLLILSTVGYYYQFSNKIAENIFQNK